MKAAESSSLGVYSFVLVDEHDMTVMTWSTESVNSYICSMRMWITRMEYLDFSPYSSSYSYFFRSALLLYLRTVFVSSSCEFFFFVFFLYSSQCRCRCCCWLVVCLLLFMCRLDAEGVQVRKVHHQFWTVAYDDFLRDRARLCPNGGRNTITTKERNNTILISIYMRTPFFCFVSVHRFTPFLACGGIFHSFRQVDRLSN